MKTKPAEKQTYETEIDPLEINEEFLRLPAQVAYWNAQYAEAYRRWLTSKNIVDRAFAVLYTEVRDEAESNRSKTTEATIKATVEMDPRYIEACQDQIAAEAEKVRLAGVLESLRTRRDALMSVGASMRAELQGNPSIRRRLGDDD